MAESSPAVEPPTSNIDDMFELNKDLEKMIDDVENLSVQLTWMVHDMVTLRTRPEVEESMRKLNEAHLRCRMAVCGDQEPELGSCAAEMETTQKAPATTSSCIDLENILRGLDSLSKSMDQLALRTHLKQCDLILCVGHPDRLAFLNKLPEAVKQQPRT